MKMKKSTITDLPNDIREVLPNSEQNVFVKEIIAQAERGNFHDFKDEVYVFSKLALIKMLDDSGEPALKPIREAVINGDYDESPDAEDKAMMKKDWLENGGTEETYRKMFGED